MGSAFFIVLENPIAGLDAGMDGKALAGAMESLDFAATEIGVTPLSEFFSADPGDVATLVSEELDLVPGELPALQQFSAQEGLATVRALLVHPVAKDERVAEDLNQCERILSVAAKNGVRWHLEIDI